MELRDFIVTPIILFLVYAVAYFVRPWVTDDVNRRYFLPALSVRILGALAVGFLYQFYYNGGDTFAFHTHGSRPLWEEIIASPANGFRLLFANGTYGPGVWDTAQRIWYWNDPQSFFVIRILAVLDLITFSSYCGSAVLFAVISFIGAWMFFLTFYRLYPGFHRWVAICILFLPTVVFWGSGIFKDTLTLSALGIATFAFHRFFIEKNLRVSYLVLMFMSFWIIFSIKKYILLSFLPAVLLWWFYNQSSRIPSVMLRVILTPIAAILALFLAYFAISKVSEDDKRYNISMLAETAKITAYDIRYGWGARLGEGGVYTLGELDGSWQGMLALAPQSINVTLFRPYFWEIKNPLMFFSAIEGFSLLIITIVILFKVRFSVFKHVRNPVILFCLIFSLIFAFGVGVSTFNFGTLSRYKIPLLPFYTLGIGLLYYEWKRDRKTAELESTE